MNKLESEGYNSIMDEVRISHDPRDPWGSNIAWMFALADYMWESKGECTADYTPSPIVDKGESSMRDVSSEYYTLTEGLATEWSYEDARRVYNVLSRYDDWLRMAGKNY